jgi:hypothetical protein
VSDASFIVRLLVLTSFPPQPSSTANVALQDTPDPLAASPLPHTKLRAHVLTRKSYIANQNNICPRPPQEDIANGFFSSRPGRYRAAGGSDPTFHCCIA